MPPSRNPYARMMRPRAKSRVLSIIIIILLLLIAAVSLYSVIDNGRVAVVRYRVTVSNLPSELEGFTILQISDLAGTRFGASQRNLAAAASRVSYNIVCVTGDAIGRGGDSAPFLEMISALGTSRPIYFITGDADPPYNPDDPNDPYVSAQQLGARWLDSTASYTMRNQTVWLTPGGTLMDNTPADTLSAYQSALSQAKPGGAGTRSALTLEHAAKAAERETAARTAMQVDGLHIIVSHKPLDISQTNLLAGWSHDGDIFYSSIDAIIAGHIAGGQWKIPGVGAVYVRGMGFFPQNVSGKAIAGVWPQIISSGVGNGSDTPFPPFRLFNTPELTLVTFTRELE